jgi:hypothetical protein
LGLGLELGFFRFFGLGLILGFLCHWVWVRVHTNNPNSNSQKYFSFKQNSKNYIHLNILI